MSRFSDRRSSERGKMESKGSRAYPADPGEFGKKTTPVRERMAKEIKEMSPEERIRKGR